MPDASKDSRSLRDLEVCTRFQPVFIPQQHLNSALAPNMAVVIPSLYGVTSALSNAAVRDFLRDSGAAFA